jgi:predicted DsbA family dithiol-disulfide isomerase
MRVDVFSDVVCPWCKAGHERFAEALARLGWDDDDVELVYRPFLLPMKPGARPRPSTFDAHRLLEWALDTAGRHAQARLQDRLLRAWHDDRADVADHDVLAALAGEVGLDVGAAAATLADPGAYAGEVRDSQAEAEEREIFAVPTYVVDGGIAIPGAQDVDTFVSLLSRIAQRHVGATPDGLDPADGGSCPA